MMIKRFFYIFSVFACSALLTGCSTNPATGKQQFTALMSPQQEVQVGAQEHKKIIGQYGLYNDKNLQSYVSQVGKRVVKDTERTDVQYKFYLLDSPIVNAFALPGGYIYISRGLLALANSESEMASVLAHEAGHITARHSAERYSHSVVTSLGAMILSTAIGSSGASEALGVGSNLYLSSYSRGQENQADSLGIRYLSRSGYTPKAMSAFLQNLNADKQLDSQLDGKKGQQDKAASYFSTHPATADRVNKTVVEARQYPQGGDVREEAYIRRLNGMVYGDSAKQGFVRGQTFYHPEIGFKFSVPNGFKITNQPSRVIGSSKDGTLVIFDMISNKNGYSPMRFMKDEWAKGKPVDGAENITINGMSAATSSIVGSVNGQQAHVRLVAIRWAKDRIARFQVVYPSGTSSNVLSALKKSTYSFKRLGASEKKSLKPYRVKIVTAQRGDSVGSLARKMVFDDYREERFRVLNGLAPRDGLKAGRAYKIVVK
ncbi:MAG: M48 family metalloprotease [Alphaproteobacteria bacterium]